ncbi:DUF4184 family protein [Thermocatellispora tengchongensis]
MPSWPCRCDGGCPSAVAAGAMAPDLPYYVPLPFSSGVTHDWWAAPLLDVPLAAGLLVLFHLALRPPLAALAPEPLRARLPAPVAYESARRLAAVAVALLFGVVTHLAWDEITQVGGYAVANWPWIRVSVYGPHRLYNVIMYVSSAGGLAVLAAWFAVWYRRAPVVPGRWPGLPGPLRGAVLAAVACAALAGAVLLGTGERATFSQYDLVREVILGLSGGAGAALACYVALWHAVRAWRPARTARRGPGLE